MFTFDHLDKIDDTIAEYKKLDPFHSHNNIMIYALGLAYSYASDKITQVVDLEGDNNSNPVDVRNTSTVELNRIKLLFGFNL